MSNSFKPPSDMQSTTSSVQQQSVFHDFYLRLKSEKAQPVRKAIENFVRNKLPLIYKAPREEQGSQVQDLMSEMTDKFNEIFPPNPEREEEETQLNGEGIENCVMKNLYQDLFQHPEEQEFNKKYVEQTLIH